MKIERTILVLFGMLLFSGMASADPISGIYSGTFINPSPGSPPAVTTGIGTNAITWGIPCNGVTNCTLSPGGITPPSGFTFTALPFSTEVSEVFVLGEIEFYNGTIQAGTMIDSITLMLDGFQITPTQFAGSDFRVISIVNTPNNSSDPVANADRATIPGAFFPAANSFGVLESQSATATLLGIFTETSPGSLTLNILGYGESTNPNGFLEGFADAPTNPVPEPTSLLLLGSGLGVIGVAALRRRK